MKGMDIRSYSLEELVRFKKENEQKFIKEISSIFSEDTFKGLKDRLLSGAPQLTAASITEKMLDVSDFLDYLEEILKKEATCKQKCKLAQELFDLSKDSDSKKLLNKYLLESSEAQKGLWDAYEKLKDLNNTLSRQIEHVYIHPSATLEQLISCKDYIFRVTQADEPILSEIGCCDIICPKADFSINVPGEISEKYRDRIEELISLVDFVKNVIYVLKGEETPRMFKFLYLNEDVNAILKFNGFDGFYCK